MQSSHFDDLTKALATSTSRRHALKTIAATTLGGILGLAGIGTAFAKCHNSGHACEENSTCCSQNCCIAAGQREGVCCDVGQICQNGQCVTPTYLYNCTCNNDFPSQHSTCSPDKCTLENLTAVCTSFCASNGGYEGTGNCNDIPC
jgi:hypothetical protein